MKKIIGIAGIMSFFVIVISSFFIGIYKSNGFEENKSAPLPEEPAITLMDDCVKVTVNTLTDEFSENQVRTVEAYSGKCVELTGVIEYIGLNQVNLSKLCSNDTLNSIKIHIDDKMASEMVDFNCGEVLVIRCCNLEYNETRGSWSADGISFGGRCSLETYYRNITFTPITSDYLISTKYSNEGKSFDKTYLSITGRADTDCNMFNSIRVMATEYKTYGSYTSTVYDSLCYFSYTEGSSVDEYISTLSNSQLVTFNCYVEYDSEWSSYSIYIISIAN